MNVGASIEEHVSHVTSNHERNRTSAAKLSTRGELTSIAKPFLTPAPPKKDNLVKRKYVKLVSCIIAPHITFYAEDDEQEQQFLMQQL